MPKTLTEEWERILTALAPEADTARIRRAMRALAGAVGKHVIGYEPSIPDNEIDRMYEAQIRAELRQRQAAAMEGLL